MKLEHVKCCLWRAIYGLKLLPHFLVMVLLAWICALLIMSQLLAGELSPGTALLLLPMGCIVFLLVTNRPVPLSPNFALSKVPGAKWSVIAQRSIRKSGDCQGTMRELIADQYTLVQKIPPGRYRAITHETVLKRIEASGSLQLCAHKLLGMDNLKSIRRLMRGSNCSWCNRSLHCRCFHMIQQSRKFYYVEFEKIAG